MSLTLIKYFHFFNPTKNTIPVIREKIPLIIIVGTTPNVVIDIPARNTETEFAMPQFIELSEPRDALIFEENS